MRIMSIDICYFVKRLMADCMHVINEHADKAHRGMTVQMEHTTCKETLTDEAAVVSEL